VSAYCRPGERKINGRLRGSRAFCCAGELYDRTEACGFCPDRLRALARRLLVVRLVGLRRPKRAPSVCSAARCTRPRSSKLASDCQRTAAS
jgi:hypothetical protein